MNHFKTFLCASFLLLGNLLPIINYKASHVNNFAYNNLFVLGDSLSDTGAFVQYQGVVDNRLEKISGCAQAFRPLMRSTCYRRVNYWKAKSFALPFYDNSFSNGPVAVQVLADLLGINTFRSGSYINGKFNNFGYNYATGAAKTLTSKELLSLEFISHLQSIALRTDNYSLEQQVKTLIYQHPQINKKDLLLVNIGNNDLSEIVSALSFYEDECTKISLMNRITKVVDTLFLQIEKLINHGFNYVVVFNNVDFSKTPRYIENIETSKIIQEVVKRYNQIFELKYCLALKNNDLKQKLRKFDFNVAFEETLNAYEVSNKITNKAAVDIDWTTAFIFNDTFQPYYVDGANEINVNNYAFFDGVHPTGSFHYEVAKKLHNFVNSVLWVN